ncbi:response regulator receiver sensor signal transduction histidine kinase, partial [Candidatus Magnetomorum sp. HK-1]
MFENKDKKMVVLIVDDNPNNLKMLIDFLKESGFKLVVAQNGNEALSRVKITKPHIILLDIMMPGLDGYETCKHLKSDEQYKDIPIIFMTALSDTRSKIKAFETGAVDYITKPFNQEEILAR